MNAKVEQYIAEQREKIEQEKQRQKEKQAEEERKQREALLDSLGLYEEEKYYTDQVFSSITIAARMGYTSENIDGTVRFFSKRKVYPELTDEEYEALLEVQREKEALNPTASEASRPLIPAPAPVAAAPAPIAEAKPAEPSAYQIASEFVASESFGGKLMKILASLVWIGGLIASIVLGRLPDRWGDLKFNFWLFLAYAAGFFIVGATYWAIGELFDNVAAIDGGIERLNRASIYPKK